MPLSVDVQGTSIVYDTEGQGPDVVFLHAGIAHRDMWQPQVEHLRRRHRCTRPDLRGFGDTPVGSEPYSRRDDLAAVLDDVGARAVTLVGCSVGAGIALDFAIERPERVRRLVLAGVTPSGCDIEPGDEFSEWISRVEAANDRGAHEEASTLEARLWVDGPRRPEGAAPAWLREGVVVWSIPINQRTDWGESHQLLPPAWERLYEVVAPTLVVVGKEDVDFVIRCCRATARRIPGARLVELDGTAHLPNLEVADVFNSHLDEVL